MYNDELSIFEKYLEIIEEAKANRMQGRGSRPDVFGSKQHLQKTAYKGREGAPEAHGFNLATSPGLSERERHGIRNVNFLKALELSSDKYFPLLGEESELSGLAQKQLEQFEKENPDHYLFQAKKGDQTIIPYWFIPKAIEEFSVFAKIGDLKEGFIESLIKLYSFLSRENNFKEVYENSLPIIRLSKTGKGYEDPIKISELYKEYGFKIAKAISDLKRGIVPNMFLLPNSTFARKQESREGQTYWKEVMLTGGSKQTAFGQTESEPSSEVTGFDPISPKKSPVKPGELEAIRIKSPEQAQGLPQKLPSLGKQPESSKTKPKRKVKKESYEPFIKLIPF